MPGGWPISGVVTILVDSVAARPPIAASGSPTTAEPEAARRPAEGASVVRLSPRAAEIAAHASEPGHVASSCPTCAAEMGGDEQREIDELERRDAEVRRHEQAHLAAAGPYATGGPSYEYEIGPNGRRYAVGGHVDVDTSEISGNPEATLRKAETIRRAALAPADPSGQDHAVAARATQMAASARAEIGREPEADGHAAAGAARGLRAYGRTLSVAG